MNKIYDALIGYTGFVGSNLLSSHEFAEVYNSKNISDAFGKSYDLLVYSGVRAEKYLANIDPDGDRKIIDNAIKNIEQIKSKRLVLISTVDVYKYPDNIREDSEIVTEGLHPYGMNRYILEKWVQENIKDHFILRLPALFGANIKKNFIFDMIRIVPSMLKEAKYEELKRQFDKLDKYYFQDDQFYKLKDLNVEEFQEIKSFFIKNDFNALSFTDYRSGFQFYNLRYLWKDIDTAIQNGVRLLNLSSEPVSAGELYEYIFQKPFRDCQGQPVNYDIRSCYDFLFGGRNGYLYLKENLLKDIKDFVRRGF